MKVLLICNYKPGVGGISGQVELLQKYLRSERHIADIFSTKASVLRRLLLAFRLRSVAKNYEVLHVHCCSGWGFLPAVIGVTVGHRLKKRLVLTYHGGGGEMFFYRHHYLVSHYLTSTDANIVLSGFLSKVFDKHQLPYTIIPNIIELDDKQFRLRETLQPNFICTRAHEPLYNIPCILYAFQKVLTEIPEASLTLVGDGSEHSNLINLAKEMNLKNVTFTGRVDNHEIYRQLDHADILLSSPTIDNMPVSILEAIAQAGDLTTFAYRDRIFLIRENAEGQKDFHQLDINDANIINSPYYYLQQNDVIYVEQKKVQARNAFISANTSIWFSLTSSLMSIATFIIALSK